MLKKAVLLLMAALFALGVTACGSGVTVNVTSQEGLEVPEGAADFLTAIYTTDQDGRYTAYLEAEETADDPDGAATAMITYYGNLSFSDLVTEALLSQLITNRIPYKYDQLYADTPATVEAVAFEAPEDGEEGCDFVVTLTVDGETETRTGAIRWEEDTALISSFWEAG
ncbi:MAG: hypothetical protein LUD84_05030 [Clostridiales bacterium]|nr:hypothetical protein [Clostridiales bacterium]